MGDRVPRQSLACLAPGRMPTLLPLYYAASGCEVGASMGVAWSHAGFPRAPDRGPHNLIMPRRGLWRQVHEPRSLEGLDGVPAAGAHPSQEPSSRGQALDALLDAVARAGGPTGDVTLPSGNAFAAFAPIRWQGVSSCRCGQRTPVSSAARNVSASASRLRSVDSMSSSWAAIARVAGTSMLPPSSTGQDGRREPPNSRQRRVREPGSRTPLRGRGVGDA